MNNQMIVQHMVDFIENKEKELQADKLNTDTKAKKGIVQSILDELDSEVKNENQKD